MLITDWFMWQFPQNKNFLDSKKQLLRDKLTTPIKDEAIVKSQIAPFLPCTYLKISFKQ